MRFTMVAAMLAATSATANTEIHRCLLEDGTFAFQEMPCPESAVDSDDSVEVRVTKKDSETPAGDDDAFDFVNPFDEPAEPPTQSEATLLEPTSPDRDECQKTARDAIDAIDQEMREQAYTSEEGQAYLAELLVLTRQLRACSQL